jgi:ATP-dependent helicase/nuclease subunit B
MTITDLFHWAAKKPAASGSRFFTVPAGRPFLECLARAILDGNLPATGGRKPDPLALSSYTLILPTRRATRAVQEAFLRASGGRAMLLPRILPIAEGQEDLTLISSASEPGGLHDDIAPAISEMERRLALTTLVMRWSEAMRAGTGDAADFLGPQAPSPGGNTPAQAAQLAAELSRLMDMVETEGASYTGLSGLVPAEHSEHWQRTLDFLAIVTEMWPQHLAEKGVTSPANRRNQLLLAEAARYAASPPQGPVIVAGVTGSVPTTAELMRAVAKLENGAIVLPALDTALDEESWKEIQGHHTEFASGSFAPSSPLVGANSVWCPSNHPQFGLAKLLASLGIARAQVTVLPGAEPSPRLVRRTRLVSEALRPAGTTGRWAELAASPRKSELADALDGVTLIEAPTAQDEAEAVALLLREAIETPGRTAALVSPDRLLARRVAIRLEAWGLKVDDSAGRPFRKTPPGAFLDLVVEAAATRFAPSGLMALLKHPLTRLGLDPFAVRRAGRALEIAAFRRPYLGQGLAGVEAALERAAIEVKPDNDEFPHPAVRRLWDEDWDGARDLIRRLTAAFAPLEAAFAQHARQPLSSLAAAHVAAAEAIARLPDADLDAAEAATGGEITSPLWDGDNGEAARRFFDQLFVPGLTQPEIAAADYPDLYRSLLSSENVRPHGPVHPRLFIWGPFEARLQQADVMILGSLNDGTWPEAADPGPWLNRSMRTAMGLPSPEERIGHAAHDFSTFLAAPRVVLTRALKVDGVPTVPSRWLMRLEALLTGLGLSGQLAADSTWLGWARARDLARSEPRRGPPQPRPPVAARPRKLSVSRIETWISNPYAIFARSILRLEPLPPLGEEPGAATKGSIIHAALAVFARKHPEKLPADIEGELLRFAQAEFEELAAHPRVAAFWMPRFARFAEWFAATEPARRVQVSRTVAETGGKLVLAAPAGPFQLTARADRIDIAELGLVITDYKTGKPPTANKVLAGYAPQLPLEAAIAEAGLFQHVPQSAVASLRYISATGGEPPGKESPVKTGSVSELARMALDGVGRLVSDFDDPATPYEPKRRARFSYKYDAYAQLARVAEWSADAGPDEEAA